MSTKMTIAYKNPTKKEESGYHLYEECFDEETVYLQIDNPKEFSCLPGSVMVNMSKEMIENMLEKYCLTKGFVLQKKK